MNSSSTFDGNQHSYSVVIPLQPKGKTPYNQWGADYGSPYLEYNHPTERQESPEQAEAVQQFQDEAERGGTMVETRDALDQAGVLPETTEVPPEAQGAMENMKKRLGRFPRMRRKLEEAESKLPRFMTLLKLGGFGAALTAFPMAASAGWFGGKDANDPYADVTGKIDMSSSVNVSEAGPDGIIGETLHGVGRTMEGVGADIGSGVDVGLDWGGEILSQVVMWIPVTLLLAVAGGAWYAAHHKGGWSLDDAGWGAASGLLPLATKLVFWGAGLGFTGSAGFASAAGFVGAIVGLGGYGALAWWKRKSKQNSRPTSTGGGSGGGAGGRGTGGGRRRRGTP